MLKKYLPSVFSFALFFAAASPLAAAADDVDLADNTPLPIPTDTTNDVFIYSTDGTIDSNSTIKNAAIKLNNGNTLTIGQSSTGQGRGTTLGMKDIESTDAAPGNLVVLSAGDGGDVRVILTGALNLSNGGNAAFGDGNGKVRFEANTLSANGGGTSGATTTLDIEKNSDVRFQSVTGGTGGELGGAKAVTINLNGGQMGVGSSKLTLLNGAINVTDSSYFGVNGTLVIAGTGLNKPVLDISGGKNLTLLKNLDDPNTLASLTIGGDSTGGGTLKMGSADSSLTVDKLTFAANAAFDPGAAGKITANSLDITANFTDVASVATKVAGPTTIKKGTTYTVAGVNNEYRGGILVQGTLAGSTANTIITLGTGAASLAPIEVDGGSIVAGAGGFTIDYADITVTKADSSLTTATLDASAGALNLTTSNLTVNLTGTDPATIHAHKGITVNSYRQLAGDVNVTTNAGNMKVLTPAVIGSASAAKPVTMDVSGAAVHFTSGLTLDRYGAVAATRATGAVDIGTAGDAATAWITANGNNRLHAGAGNTLTFNNVTGESGRMVWNGKGNSVVGEVDQSGFDATVRAGSRVDVATLTAAPAAPTEKGYHVGSMTIYGQVGLGMKNYPDAAAGSVLTGILTSDGSVLVKDGGILSADYGAIGKHAYVVNNLAGTDNKNILKIEKGGTLRADTSTIYAKGFNSVDINGTFVAGLLDSNPTPTEAARLVADSNVNINYGALITMTTDLARTVTSSAEIDGATKLIEIDNSAGTKYKINNNANMSSQSMLGIFGFALNSDSTILYVETAKGQLTLDGTEADRVQGWNNLKDIWGEKQVNRDLSDVIYDVIKGDIVSEPPDSVAGNKNLNLLESIGAPEGRVVGIDTLEYLNGAHLYGITDVAIQTSRSFMSDITNRAKVLGCSFVAAREVSGSDAYASTAMNDVLNNRFWLGGSGLLQNANGSDGFSGYKYKSYGFVGGYDRVAAQNLAAGASFAYNKGKYEDKGAADHDSDIESFSAGLYATYSNPCGWFLTGHGAFTYSQNDIRELRRDPDAGRYSWAQSNFHTNTWSFGALFGYDFRLLESGLVMTPSVGINYINAKNSDHDSVLDGVATQRVTKAKNSVVYVPVDFTVQYDVCMGPQSKLRVEGSAGYSYNLRGSGMTGSIEYIDLDPLSVIGIHGRDNAKHSYKLGGGVRYSYRTFDIGMRYDYLGQTDYRAHRLMATAGISF